MNDSREECVRITQTHLAPNRHTFTFTRARSHLEERSFQGRKGKGYLINGSASDSRCFSRFHCSSPA